MDNRSSSDLQESTPSFFKVIRYPSAGHLSLPNAFVKRYFNKIPKNPTLVTATGEHSWRMKFVKIGEDYCFAHGWDELVKDVGLCSRDVVVFWLMDSRIFRLSFLGANGCEKYVPVNKISDEYDDVVKDDGKCHNDDANLCFERVFGQRSFRYYMLLPIKFVKAAGLEHKESVKLKDHEGKEWTMRLTAHGIKGSASIKYSLSAGWAMFRKYYKLSEGDVGTFTFDKQEGVINLTQLIKSKRPIKQETLVGTESCYGDANVQIEDQWSPTEKPCSSGGAGVKVKTEYDSGPEMVVVKENRGRPLLKRCAEVKIEYEWVPEMMRKPKREMALPEKPSKGSGVEVNAGMGAESVFRSKQVVYF